MSHSGPITEPREALELALRSILDDDEAVSAAGIVLDEGWLPPSEVLYRMTQHEIGLAIDALAMLVRPHESSEYRPLLHRLQEAYKR